MIAISRPRADWLPRATIAGYIASIAMAILFVAAYGFAQVVALVPLNMSLRRAADFTAWLYALTHNSVLDFAATSLFAAAAVHLVVGVLWALVYAYAFEPRLQGNAWARGAIFSLLPWILSLVVFLPLFGGGWFGLAIGAGPLPAIGNLVLHLCYGLILGGMYGPLGDLSTEELSAAGGQDDRELMQRYEQAEARGLALGAGLGVLIGVLLALLSPSNLPFSTPPLVFVPAAMALGAGFGALWGSLNGLASPGRPAQPH